MLGATFAEPLRRAKYLLLPTDRTTLICHLGMSGNLCLVPKDKPPLKHSHVDLELESGYILRYTDPRRFGLLVLSDNPYQHKLLAHLGVEPLTADFNGDYLHQICKKRTMAIKNLLMTNQIVVGIGNIYASESLFMANIAPLRAANTLTLKECTKLVQAVKFILNEAIKVGGTTLRDFVSGDGKPGYFVQQLAVYGRGGKPCLKCTSILQEVKIGGRSSVFCPKCQK